MVWFKDERPVAKPEFQAQIEDAGNYLCAVQGQESLLSYPVALDVQRKYCRNTDEGDKLRHAGFFEAWKNN